MRKIDRKTEKYLKELFKDIEIPSFRVCFGSYIKRPKSKWNDVSLRRSQLLKVLPSCLCVLLMLFTIAFVPHWGKNDLTDSGGGNDPVIEEPETNYYMKQLEQVRIEDSTFEDICSYKGYIAPFLTNKLETVGYKLIVHSETEIENILGLKISFMYISENLMYSSTISILDDSVKDSMDQLPETFLSFSYRDLDIKYSLLDFDGTLYIYNAWFMTGKTNYILTYQSFMEDIEQGIATIF